MEDTTSLVAASTPLDYIQLKKTPNTGDNNQERKLPTVQKEGKLVTTIVTSAKVNKGQDLS